MAETSTSIDDNLERAATFLREHELTAVPLSGIDDDGRNWEGVSFGRYDTEVAILRFVNQHALLAEYEEARRRLSVAGLINEVVAPVRQAMHSIYQEGSGMTDPRLFRLPGFE